MSTTFTVDVFCSLDGYGMASGWPGYWGKEGPELREDRVRTFAQDQVLVFGGTTFRELREFVTEYDEPYYDSLNRLPKIVFSRTLEEPLGWAVAAWGEIPEGVGRSAAAGTTRIRRGDVGRVVAADAQSRTT